MSENRPQITGNDIVGVALAIFVILTRSNQRLADFYATALYPHISMALSYVSSFFKFSLYDALVLVLIASAIGVLFSVRREGFLGRLVRFVLWTYVWFFMGWCVNYNRSSIFERTSTRPSSFDNAEFVAFLDDFTTSLNASYTEAQVPDLEELIPSVKTFYASVPSQYGLCTPREWQKPKWMFYNRLYSKCGVTGYMGPLTGEAQLNSDARPEELPFLFAHEYSHLLGVSNEAEANWWAFQACVHSDNAAVRYHGYCSLLTYVANNAARVFTEDEYAAWLGAVRPEILEQQRERQEYWQSLRSEKISNFQNRVYNLFLKSNKISSGIANYSEVVQLLISLPDVEGMSGGNHGGFSGDSEKQTSPRASRKTNSQDLQQQYEI